MDLPFVPVFRTFEFLTLANICQRIRDLVNQFVFNFCRIGRGVWW